MLAPYTSSYCAGLKADLNFVTTENLLMTPVNH